MKYLLHFLGSLLRFAAISIVTAILYGGVRYLAYLLSWVEKPTWSNIFGMATILWAFMVLYGFVAVGRYISKNYGGQRH